MEIKEKIESSYDNVMAAVQIANTLSDVKADKMKEVFRCIKDYMSNLGYKELPGSWENEIDTYYGAGRRRDQDYHMKYPLQIRV